MTCDVLHGLAKCRCRDGGRYLRELQYFQFQRVEDENGESSPEFI